MIKSMQKQSVLQLISKINIAKHYATIIAIEIF